MLILVIAFVISAYTGWAVVGSFRADLMKQEVEAVDKALYFYSLSHKPLDGTLNGDGKTNIYPESLMELGVIQYNFKCPIGHITISTDVDVSNGVFIYKPVKGAEGEFTSYTLQVRLPDGYIYTSPGSGLSN